MCMSHCMKFVSGGGGGWGGYLGYHTAFSGGGLCLQAQQPVAINHIGKDTKTKESKEREREREKERNAVMAMKLQLAGGGLP